MYSRSCNAAYLVAQALGGDDSDLIANALVGLEVESETRVVALNDDLGRLLDSLSPDATHFDRFLAVGLVEEEGWWYLREVGGRRLRGEQHAHTKVRAPMPSIEIWSPHRRLMVVGLRHHELGKLVGKLTLADRVLGCVNGIFRCIQQ